MHFFGVTYSAQKLIFVTVLCFTLTQSALCQENNDIARIQEQLNSLRDGDIIQEIEETLGVKINKIRDILEYGGPDQQNMIDYLHKTFSALFFEKAQKLYEAEKLVNNEIASTYVPYSCLCAMIFVTEVLEDCYKNIMKEIPELSDAEIFESSDVALQREPTPVKKGRSLTKEEFVAFIQNLGPHLTETLVDEISNHDLPSFRFRGRIVCYYGRVAKSFSKWLDFFGSQSKACSEFRDVLEKEIRDTYGEENVSRVREETALLLSRDYALGNDFKHRFWKRYSFDSVRLPQVEFHDILDTFHHNGWYYTIENLELFNLLLRAYRKFKKLDDAIVLEFEPLMQSRSKKVGVPQLALYRYSKRDLKYFLKKQGTY